MDRDAVIYKNVLDNMSGGVMTVGLDGRILTFNPAAARILGLARDEVLDHVLAEVLMAIEGLDAFFQALMDAVYEADVEHQRVVEVQHGDKTVSLAVTSSYLQSVRDGEVQRIGVIAIFNDITELKDLREAELRMAEKAKAQHAELQDAYRRIEENNQALRTATQRERVAALGVVVLFLAVGLYAWQTDPGPDFNEPSLPVASETVVPADLRTVVVTPQRLTSTVILSGHLAPRREVQVTSPLTGTVAALHFQHGERVTHGQRLVELDTTEAEKKYREAQAAYIKARLRFHELENWENSVEVVRARRTLNRTRRQLETQQNKRDETAFLLEKGIIPASEHEAAEQQLYNMRLDYEAVQQDLEAVLARGGAQEKQVARLELDNARIQMQLMEDILQKSRVNAPVTGVVLPPRQSEQDGQRLVIGGETQQGALLLTVGDLDGLSVVGEVDEVDVAKVRLGQQVAISGDAFPGVELRGSIVHVSSQASQPEQGRENVPVFEVRAVIENLSAAQRQQVRLGMSANLEVVVYDKPDSLLVPLSAVQVRNGKTWLRVKDRETGAVKQIEVDTGVTTLDAVEIVHGLQAGDEVMLSET